MKAIQSIMISLTAILLFNTVVCGFWVRVSGEMIKQADKNYHMGSGFLTVIFVVVTMFIIARR